ncbi:unnamed protein product [Arabidopsis thaliana]|jgi:hypothetical protein|uniref:Emb/CAB62594.1 n=2 Tax=Arabidopsis thaliana TaxID=3702 RepID=Q9FLK7_ARATH|nr:Plant calmodulin-binding protein-like protein [Arabidopsis thaliana]NP_001330296.1 Plant calmodulin-binding protein-like protein [Arabidopsis thaliana]NP_200934.1 Plant calmodulin-binding protein-like protein [Arabidopsis thaliana]AED97444.1 Plant calmodulin-binding protein-like protein [Arabidopsis thaliana]ANM68551.1 Plant calmodulin-binding protein-like protein [Arabidopsis thaliana]ANM68552.1 Plant calmodulin-binding protein-like protein [Arabidopsis thaliana]VYS71055.1 unnamed protein|eukprot:NP_001318853.1 Plant calmodulin-binding protein-like protein [Arabidopsis thaliana]
MAEENTSEVKDIENSSDTNPPKMSEEGSLETVRVKDVENVEDVIAVVAKDQEEIIPEIIEVPKPQGGTLRRHSTGTISKPQVQSRYRGNHRVGSTHDLCKHGKKCDQDDAVKPWKIARRKSVEGSVVIKVETPSSTRKSLGSVSRQSPGITKPDSSVSAKRDALAVKKKPCASVNSESSSKEGSEIAKSVDGLSVKSNDRARKNKETESGLSGSAVVKKVPALRTDKSSTSTGVGSSKVCAPKNLKNVEKAKTTQTISGEDVKEKTVCVVESSVKGVKSEKQPSSEKKTMKSGNKSLSTTPKRGSSPTKQIPGKISTGLTKKKETGSADVVEANPKPEKKVRPKKTGVKVSLAQQMTFKKGKVLDPKPEDSSPRWIKFKKRVVQELKTQSEGKKKNLKDRRLGVETKTDSCEGSKREKVVLRHRKVEGKKKMITLFNNVIEETVNKLTKVRKHKVKALIGAFETVISLQDTNKTSHKPQSKATTSASKVRPLVSEQ